MAALLATSMTGVGTVTMTSPVMAGPPESGPVGAPAPAPDPGPDIGVRPGPAANLGESQFGPLENWPLIALHSALDSQGRVLTYGTNGDGTQTGQFIYDIWTPGPSAAGGHNTLTNTTNTDLFCSLQINRADTGEMLLFGGDNWTGTVTTNTGNPDINSYSPTTGQLTKLPGMNRSRWYGTGTTLPDGTIFVQGGDGGYDRPELWSPENGAQLLDLDTSGINWWYPRNFVLPDGRLFGIDIDGRMYYISADLQTLTMAGRLAPDRWGYGSTAVMYENGKILHFGGMTETAVTIDVTGANPVVTPTASLSATREWVDGTILPDGRVLANGGARYYTAANDAGAGLDAYGVVYSAEIWDPATGTWTLGPSGSAARLYHSTSLLLPDGRVLIAGGGAPGPVANTNAELFSPDYLMADGGGPAARPAIVGVSSTDVDPGDSLTINVANSPGATRATLVKSGSVTHSFNMDQRFIELSVTREGDTLYTAVPASSAQVTPGYYLLSVIDGNGVPSESVMIRIAPGGDDPAPVAPPVSAQGQISRLYKAYFVRDPNPAELSYWVATLNSGVGLVAISDFFSTSAEFLGQYGPLDDAAFIDRVYQNVLGRGAEGAGRAYWLGQMAAGASRGQVMLSFSESPEFIARTQGDEPLPPPPAPPAPPATGTFDPEIRRLYLAYFLREAEGPGLAYWIGQRTAGVSLITVSDSFATSPEFQLRYGQTSDAQFVALVYQNVLGRPAEPSGHQYWLGQLAAGVTRGEVMVGFSESAEFVITSGLGA